MRSLLADWVYLRYWLAVVVSYLGDGFARVTIVFVAARLTSSPATFLAAVVIAQLLPTGVLGAFIGPLVDRFSPQRLLVAADLFRVLVVGAMIGATHSPVLLLLLIVLEGMGKAVFETARIAAIPTVVAGHSVPDAIALFQSTVQVLNLVGPLVGGLLLGVTGVSWVLLINSATFLVSALLLGSLSVLRTATAHGAPPGEYFRSVAAGMRGVWQVPTLRLLLWALVPMMVAVGLFTTNINAQLLTTFALPAFQFGLAQAVVGAGAIAGALLGPALMRRWPSARLLALAGAAFAVGMMVVRPIEIGWPGTGLVSVLAWCGVTGLGMSLIQVPVANLLLRDLPADIRGRGVAIVNALMINLMIAGVLLGGVLGDWLGVGA